MANAYATCYTYAAQELWDMALGRSRVEGLQWLLVVDKEPRGNV